MGHQFYEVARARGDGASDYEKIAAENIRLYGEDPILLELLEQIYADRAHFIFEILQNAEDAGATEVRFNLFRNRLDVLHNGSKKFDTADVIGVCGVGKGTKKGDLTKIGKFGIGFKSVDTYTRSPGIHSGSEHFVIEKYVRPRGIKRFSLLSPWTTLFVFPFDHVGVPAHEAFVEIHQKLRALSSRTPLFLRKIDAIKWYVHDTDKDGARIISQGEYLRDDLEPLAGGRRLEVTCEADRKSYKEEWLVFERALYPPGESKPVYVEAAFELRPAKEGIAIVPARDTDLVVYFPTQKETHLGFLIQGAYQTTPARDNVPAHVEWNKHLVRETATLIREVLPALRDAGLMSVSLLQALPIRAVDFAPGSMFRPIFDEVRAAIREEDLLPTSDGSHAPGRKVKLARGAGLVELLDPMQLGTLFGKKSPYHWLTPRISDDRTPDLFRYLAGFKAKWTGEGESIEPLVPELMVEADTVARRLSSAFLAPQSDQWLVKLYSFFQGQTRGLGTNDFPTVAPTVAGDPKAHSFLQELGLQEPDAVVEIFERILPKYESGRQVSKPEHEEDLRRITSVLEWIADLPASDSTGVNTLWRIKQTPFLCAENAVSGKQTYRRPTEIYERTPELEDYFEGSDAVWFLDERDTDISNFAGLLDVADEVRVIARTPDSAGHILLRADTKHFERSTRRFDPQAEMFGLEHALRTMTVVRARYLWNRVLPQCIHLIRGEVQIASTRTFDSPRIETRESVMGRLLLNAKWLPDKGGTLRRPHELKLTDLHAGFDRDGDLALALVMQGSQPKEVTDALKKAGFSESAIRFLQAHPEAGSKVDEYIEELQQQEVDKGDERGVEHIHNFGKSLSERFDRPGVVKLIEDNPPFPTPVRDPELRRKRVLEEIKEAQKRGRVRRRFSRVPTSIWDRKDSAVRGFLLNEYLGRCQICEYTFPKTDGTPYFEGLYLAPRLEGEWLDRPGNVFSLCANCCAKLQFAAVTATNLDQQIMSIRSLNEGGNGQVYVQISLQGEPTEIHFSERHMIDLQEMVRASQ